MIGYVILAGAAIFMIVMFFKSKPKEEKLQQQQEKYEALLEKFGVPEKHYKIVISQSKVYNLHNCPAIVWIEGDKVKSLLFRINPILVENDLEDFMYIASQPLVDFRRFDGTEYPDWACQSEYVQQLFLPYAEITKSVGGIDYKRQMYWIGTMCVYAPSLHQFFEMIDRPLAHYEIRVDHVSQMKQDGSIPERLLQEHATAKEKAKEEKEQTMELEAAMDNLKNALEIVRRAEEKAGMADTTDKVNQLVQILLKEGKSEELLRSTTDKEYQQELFKKYGL